MWAAMTFYTGSAPMVLAEISEEFEEPVKPKSVQFEDDCYIDKECWDKKASWLEKELNVLYDYFDHIQDEPKDHEEKEIEDNSDMVTKGAYATEDEKEICITKDKDQDEEKDKQQEKEKEKERERVMQAQLQEKDSAILQLEGTIKELKLQAYIADTKEKEKQKEKQQKMDAKLAAKNEKILTLANTIKELTLEVENSKEKAKETDTRLQEKEEKMETLEKTVKELKLEVYNEKMESSTMLLKYNIMQEQCKYQENEIYDLKAEIIKLNKENSVLSEQIENLRSIHSKTIRQTNKIAKQASDVMDKQSKIHKNLLYRANSSRILLNKEKEKISNELILTNKLFKFDGKVLSSIKYNKEPRMKYVTYVASERLLVYCDDVNTQQSKKLKVTGISNCDPYVREHIASQFKKTWFVVYGQNRVLLFAAQTMEGYNKWYNAISKSIVDSKSKDEEKNSDVSMNGDDNKSSSLSLSPDCDIGSVFDEKEIELARESLESLTLLNAKENEPYRRSMSGLIDRKNRTHA